MNSKRVKKQQVPKEDDRSPIPVLKLSHLYQNNSLLMHSNWSHCLQEVFNSGKLAEMSYHQHFKNFAEKLEDVTLEDVSSTQQYEETPMISERVKKQ